MRRIPLTDAQQSSPRPLLSGAGQQEPAGRPTITPAPGSPAFGRAPGHRPPGHQAVVSWHPSTPSDRNARARGKAPASRRPCARPAYAVTVAGSEPERPMITVSSGSVGDRPPGVDGDRPAFSSAGAVSRPSRAPAGRFGFNADSRAAAPYRRSATSAGTQLPRRHSPPAAAGPPP